MRDRQGCLSYELQAVGRYTYRCSALENRKTGIIRRQGTVDAAPLLFGATRRSQPRLV
jgi:hypothetical protein